MAHAFDRARTARTNRFSGDSRSKYSLPPSNLNILNMNDNDERGIVPVLNSSHSTVKIDSLCIKLGIMKEKDHDAPKCRHFSIRGYVSGMREKGNSNLLPFTKELHPMDIPNFRYWLCEKCLQNNETANASTETTFVSGCDQCVFSPSARSCPQQDFNGAAVLPFGEGTSGLKPVGSKNNGETILAALEAGESQTSQEIPDKVKASQELIKLCTVDTNAGKNESNELKDHENRQKTSIVNETKSQPLESGQQIDNYQNGHPRRKARKVRLLKELLCGDTEIQQQKKDNSSPLPPPSQIKRKMLPDHHDHEHHHDDDHHHNHDHDPKKAKAFKGDAIAKNNVVEHSRNPGAREFGENINKYEWNKHGTQRSSIHGKVGSDPMTAWRSIFSDMGRTDIRVPPTYGVSKSRGTEPSPNFMNPLKSDKKLNFSKKISSNPIKSKFSVDDSRRMKDDNRSDTELGLNLSLNYDPQSDIRSEPSIQNRLPNQDYSRKTGFFLGESSNFPHRIQSDSKSKEISVHEKRLYTQLPYGSCSGHQKLDFSDPYKRNIGVRGYSEFTRPNNHQRQERVFSYGRSDEREIIELMAKNQYERNLCEANNGIISGFHKLRNEGMTSSHHEYLSMIRPPSSSIATSERVGPMRNPAGGFFHQDQVSSFTMNQKKPLNGVWMSDSGPQRHYDSSYHYASNGNNKTPQTHLYNATNMQVLEAFNKYNNGTHQHEAAQMQFGQTYAKYSDRDKGKNMMDLDLNLVAPNVVEEQNNLESLDLNPDRMCSFDASYSNETIPAMQLLSLMDAGKLSQPFSVTGQTIVTKPKPISSCFSHCSSTMTEKTNPMVNSIGSSYSNVFRTGQNVKLTTSSHGQQVYHKQQEVKARGTSLASVGCRPEDSYVFPLPWQARGGQNKRVNIAFGPKSDSSRTEICTINRNPADFSTPGPENEYMISVEDLACNGESSYGSNSQKKAIKPTS
ncbi:hypothetical protein L1987_45312 [Smallanthus sonchifolius]|uniref:Uncharacterized protein n=1 Tax=Smallanthus sonchifolius TaxID=185202 RepID=A0ACB9GRR1_9ASTR|nr:hypothetical protein L1987_45312 [Smallanthus sonchifolius]